MNSTQKELSKRIDRQSQRLDTKVKAWPGVSEMENERAGLALVAIANRLASIISDAAAAPEELVERLGRYVPDAKLREELMVPDHEKLDRMNRRLEELVPGDLTADQRIDQLETWFRAAHPEKAAV